MHALRQNTCVGVPVPLHASPRNCAPPGSGWPPNSSGYVPAMPNPRKPNLYLRALLQEVGWIGEELARAVNRAGAESGLALRYDRTSVAHWLAGTRPSEPVPALVAEVLSRALRRTVTLEDAGLARPPRTPAAPEAPRGGGPVYRLGDGSLPAFGPARSGEPAPALSGLAALGVLGTAAAGSGRIGRPHLRTAEDLLVSFSTAEQSLGGNHVKGARAGFLSTTMSAWITAPAPPRVHHDLLRCASHLSYLCAFMFFDSGRQGTAQAYYRTAAELAAEAADRVGHAVALRAMSTQAHYLGHHAHSLALAEAAGEHLRALDPGRRAFVTGQRALAAAAMGDRHTAHRQLAVAQRLLERADSTHEVVGSYDWASYGHQEAETLASLGDTAGAITSLTRSIRERGAGQRRARAVTTARLAELLLDHGHLDRACAAWQSVLDDYPHLDSGRVHTAVGAMRSRLRGHMGAPGVRALLARAATVTGPPRRAAG